LPALILRAPPLATRLLPNVVPDVDGITAPAAGREVRGEGAEPLATRGGAEDAEPSCALNGEGIDGRARTARSVWYAAFSFANRMPVPTIVSFFSPPA
jgi:hypothetical protein